MSRAIAYARRLGYSVTFSAGLALLALCGVNGADLNRIAAAKVRRIQRNDARRRGRRVI